MSVAALIVAAGRGRRMERSTPKQYLEVAGKTVLRHTLEGFLNHPQVNVVQVVIHPDDAALYQASIEGLTSHQLRPEATGAETRAASVLCGLKALEQSGPTKVLIHDAARPFCPSAVIDALIATLDHSPGACAGLPVVDALWKVTDLHARAPVSRDRLWRAQTPQAFDYASILTAHLANSDEAAADDVAIACAAGLEVVFVTGSEDNFKITTPNDLDRAETLLAHKG